MQLPVISNRQITATVTTQPTHGKLTSQDAITWTYTPEQDYSGPDSFVVTFDNGLEMAAGMVNVTVTPVNDAPKATPDSFAAAFGGVLTVPTSALVMNDSDIDSMGLSVTDVLPVDHGTVSLSGTNVTFTPQSGYQGIATFSYKLSDGTDFTMGTVTVTIGNNSAPVAMADTRTGTEDTTVQIPVAALLANDTDADTQTLVLDSVDSPTHGTVALAGNTISFVPDPNYNGPATFRYGITDGAAPATATVTINIAAVNDAPQLTDDLGFVATEDTGFTFTRAQLLGNDTDVDGDTLTITAVGNATHGTVSLPASAVGDTVLFTPGADYNGSASFDYTVSDGTTSVTGHVFLNVGAVNDLPRTTADTAAGMEDTNLALTAASLLTNDTDVDGDTLTLTGVGNATHGTVSLQNGMIVFVPAPNYSGSATFDYTVSDGNTTATGTVTLTIAAVNDPPSAVDDDVTTAEDVPVMSTVLINDLDIDGGALSIASGTQPSHGTVTFAGTTALYTPAANYSGPDLYTYIASDGAGGMSTGTVRVTVTPVPDGPVAANDSLTLPEDASGSIDVRLNDSDADNDALTVTAVTSAAHGTVTIVNGVPTYTPVANYFGPDAFQYTVKDPDGNQAMAGVSITVTPVDDAPVAFDDFYTANDDNTLDIFAVAGLLQNDTDIDGATLTVQLVTPPQYGTIDFHADGSFEYHPDSCESADFFTYQVFDGTLTSNTATVRIDINHAPYGEEDYYDVIGNTGGSGAPTLTTANYPACNGSGTPNSVLCLRQYGDDDVDDDPLTATLATGPTYAQFFVFNTDGSFSYKPIANYFGYDYFSYYLSDGKVTAGPVDVFLYIYNNSFTSTVSTARKKVRAIDDSTPDFGSIFGGQVPPGPKCCRIITDVATDAISICPAL